MKINARQGDIAWAIIVTGIIIYELVADDLLSEATERYCGRYPWLTRLTLAAVGLHLGCLMPSAIDVFSSQNVAHRWAFTHRPLVLLARPARMTYAVVDLGVCVSKNATTVPTSS